MRTPFLFVLFVIAGAALADTATKIESPGGTYMLVQSRKERGSDRTEWMGELKFAGDRGRDFVLEPTGLLWRGDYYISPSERWVLRIQKTGSGDTTAYLYKVNGKEIMPRRGDFGEMAWRYYKHKTERSTSSLYHTNASTMPPFLHLINSTPICHASVERSANEAFARVLLRYDFDKEAFVEIIR